MACGVLMVTVGGAPSASAQAGVANVRYGDQGAAVKCVQIAVNDYYHSRWMVANEISEDGIFGPDTLRAVEDFQRALNDPYYTVDGTVGPRTGTELYLDYLEQSDPWCYTVIPTQS